MPPSDSNTEAIQELNRLEHAEPHESQWSFHDSQWGLFD